jgi:hypothetical protein
MAYGTVRACVRRVDWTTEERWLSSAGGHGVLQSAEWALNHPAAESAPGALWLAMLLLPDLLGRLP